MNYPKNRFQCVPIAALRLYNIQRENLVFEKSLCKRHSWRKTMYLGPAYLTKRTYKTQMEKDYVPGSSVLDKEDVQDTDGEGLCTWDQRT